MKQVFCDIEMAAEEKSVEIHVRLADEGEHGRRSHYCTMRASIIRLDAYGVHPYAPVFCPLCGGLVTAENPTARDRFVEKIPGYAGVLCEHGYPSLPCRDLVGACADYELRFRWGVPEYRAAGLPAEVGLGDALHRWAMPCVICRDGFVRDHYGVLEHELRRLCEALCKKSQGIHAQLEAVQSDLDLVHGLLETIDSRKIEVERTFGEVAVGFVYAITDGSAIKIGWTRSHPGRSGGRLSQLQTAHPLELRLIGAFLSSQRHEAELHAKFSQHRLRGEWFRYVPEIVEYFDKT